MARAQWPFSAGRPMVQLVLTQSQGGKKTVRSLLADTAPARRIHRLN